jgi:hypothetical protein
MVCGVDTMKTTRCEEVLVQLIVRTYDEAGRPVGERVLGRPNASGGIDPIKVFRNGETRDFWAYLDSLVAASEQSTAQATPVVVPPAKTKVKR